MMFDRVFPAGLSSVFIVVLALTLLVGCATQPEQTPELDTVSVSDAIQKAKTTPNVFAAEKMIADILSISGLSRSDRLDAHLTRARVRQDSGYNRPGALEDMNVALPLFSSAEPATPQWYQYRDMISKMVQDHSSNLRRLQNISDWANDTIGLGDIDSVAKRYRKSKLTPTEGQVQILEQAGFICMSPNEGRPVHRFGQPPAYSRGLVWCNVNVSP